MATVELRFGALAIHVRTARLIAASLGRRTGLQEPVLDEVKLAVGESCARAVAVHARSAPDELVTVRLSDDDGFFRVQVIDRGPPGAEMAGTRDGAARVTDLLNAAALAAADPEATSALPDGAGLALVTSLVDDVDVTRNATGTSVTMRWARGAASS